MSGQAFAGTMLLACLLAINLLHHQQWAVIVFGIGLFVAGFVLGQTKH